MNKYMALKSLFISRPALPVARIATWVVFAAAMLFALNPASAEVKFEDDLNVEEELHCLALNIYHEARGEPELGKFAVANVTMNRVNDARFPKTVCDVVRQGGEGLEVDLAPVDFSIVKPGESLIQGEAGVPPVAAQ